MPKPIPPGPRGLPLLGHLTHLSGWVAPLTADAERYGDVIPYQLGPRPYLFINDPAMIMEVLVTKHMSFTRSDAHRLVKPLQGNGIFMNEDYESWLSRRKMMAPSFHKSALAGYGKVIVEMTDRVAASWPTGRAFDVYPEMNRVALLVVSKALFGAELQHGDELQAALKELMAAFAERMRFFVPLPEWLPLPVVRRMRRAVVSFDRLIARFIAEHRAANVPGDADFLAMLLAARDDAGRGLTDTDVRDEATTLLFGGYETSANALTFSLYRLAAHPEIQQRMQEEVERELGGRPPTFADLPRLQYIDAFINEILRLYPASWGLIRMAAEDVEIGGYLVPKGWHVMLSNWILHRDRRYWREPLRFDPDRWLDGSANAVPKGVYSPFGYGGRRCLGLDFARIEMALFLCRMAQRFRFELASEHPPEVEFGWTARPKSRVELHVEPLRPSRTATAAAAA